MDKKKLIGTIIGVTLFAALIAGATFAWLTFDAEVTNGNYNTTTMDFVINYTKGTDIADGDDGVPILSAATSTDARGLTVSAYRTATSAEGTLYIKMTSTSDNDLTTSGALNYAVCSGTSTAAACTGSLTSGSTGVLNAGTVTTLGETTMYQTDTIPTAQTYYWIFFWLDSSTITNDHIGDTFSGYIHASATQR